MPQLPTSAVPAAEEKVSATPAMPQPPIVKKAIEVEALTLGFYDNHRKIGGDRFTVPSIEHCGNWMRCIDPKHEKARVERLEAKRKKANAAGLKEKTTADD